jgi:hypothetical protein
VLEERNEEGQVDVKEELKETGSYGTPINHPQIPLVRKTIIYHRDQGATH